MFNAHDIGYFFYNGGNDSADTCLKVSQLGEQLGYPIACIGVPKTIDNDLPVTDAARASGRWPSTSPTSIREAGFDVASMARTSTRVFILEVMGRHAGWITAAMRARRGGGRTRRRTSCCSPRSRSTRRSSSPA